MINIERMQAALDSKSYLAPKGLDREQIRQWILGIANIDDNINDSIDKENNLDSKNIQ